MFLAELCHEKGCSEIALQAWKIAVGDMTSLLRAASEARFGDTATFSGKIDEVLEMIKHQSVLYEQLTCEYDDQKRVHEQLP